jgi:hypothetical protein
MQRIVKARERVAVPGLAGVKQFMDLPQLTPVSTPTVSHLSRGFPILVPSLRLIQECSLILRARTTNLRSRCHMSKQWTLRSG